MLIPTDNWCGINGDDLDIGGTAIRWNYLVVNQVGLNWLNQCQHGR
ncbi:hypothetical protein O9929_24090 [Vibrio lentus]|nr:hypothetical protein [Vibrio lentus]